MSNVISIKTIKIGLGVLAVTALLAFVGWAAVANASFDRSLKQGMTGDDVMELQEFLNTDVDTMVASTGVGSAGSESKYFGSLTKAAVVKFQNKYASEVLTPIGLTSGTGYFGTMSRAKADALVAGGTTSTTPGCETGDLFSRTTGTACVTTTPPVTTLPAGCTSTTGFSTTTGASCTTGAVAPAEGTINVALASDTPAAAYHASGTAYNGALKMTFSGSGTVSSVVVKRSGLSIDSNISGVAAFNDAGTRLTANFVNFSDNKATLTFSPALAVSGSTNVWIKTNISGTTGTYTLSVNAATDVTSAATIGGTFPITGNTFSLVSGTSTVGSITADAVVVQSNGTNDATIPNIDLGTTGYLLARFRFAAGAAEDVNLRKLTLYNSGNTNDADIANIKLSGPDGTVLATVTNPVNRYVNFDLSATPYLLGKGLTRDFSVNVDLVGGSTRNVRLAIQNDYDIDAVGVATGSGLLATAATTVDGAFPIGDTSGGSSNCAAGVTCINKVAVAAGTALFSRSASSPAGNIPAGANSQVIGSWDFTPQGENMEMRQVAYTMTYTTALIGTFRIQVNGSTVYSIAGASIGATGVSTGVTLSTYPTLIAGQKAVITIVADISSTAASGVTYLGNMDVTQVKRINSNDIVDPSVTLANANTLVVSTASLTASKNSSYPNTTIVAGATEAKAGSFNLTASTTEDVVISSLTLSVSNVTNVSNLKIKDATTGLQLGPITSTPAATGNVVSMQLTIPKGTTKTLDVYVTTNSSTTGTEIATLTAVSAIGTPSSSSITATGLSTTGQTITFATAGTLTITLDTTNTPVTQVLHSSQASQNLLAVRLTANNSEDIVVNRVQVGVTNGVTSLKDIMLYVDGVQKGVTTQLNGSAALFADSGASGLFTVTKDTTVTMYVKGSTTASGTMNSQAVAGLALDYVEGYGMSGSAQVKPGTATNTTHTVTDTTATGASITVGSTTGFHNGDVVFVYDGNSAGSLGMVTAEPTSTTAMTVATIAAVATPSSNTVHKIETGATTAASAGTALKAGAALTVTSTADFAVGDAVIVVDSVGTALGWVQAIGSSTSMTIRTLTDLAGTASRVSKIGTATLSTGITTATAFTTTTVTQATTVTSTTGFNVGDFVLLQDTTANGTFGMVTAIGSTTAITLAVNANLTPTSTTTATLIRVGSVNPSTTLTTTAATASARVIAATATTVTSTTGFGANDVVISAAATLAGTAPTSVNVILGKIGAITSSTVMTIGSTTADAAAASTRVTRLPMATSSGRAITIHDVEPTIGVTAGFTGGPTTASSLQDVGKFDVRADGDRNMDVTSVNVQANGNNLPWNYVTAYELWAGSTQISTNTPLNSPLTFSTTANVLTGTSIELCTADVTAAGEIRLANAAAVTAAGNKIAVGDTIVIFVNATNYITAKVDAKVTASSCSVGGAATDITLTVSNSATTGTAPLGTTVTSLKSFNVLFDTNATTPLTARVITAGSTETYTVKADTTSVRTGLASGTSASYSTKINGTQGSATGGGLTWGYTPSGGSAITGLTISDSYSVNGPTFTY